MLKENDFPSMEILGRTHREIPILKKVRLL